MLCIFLELENETNSYEVDKQRKKVPNSIKTSLYQLESVRYVNKNHASSISLYYIYLFTLSRSVGLSGKRLSFFSCFAFYFLSTAFLPPLCIADIKKQSKAKRPVFFIITFLNGSE